MCVHLVDVAGDASAVAPRHRPKLQIFVDGHADKGTPRLGYMSDTEADDVLSGAAGKGDPVEPDVAAEPDHSQSARSVVVLPAPFAPSKVTMPPSGSVKSRPCNAWFAP